MSRSRSRTVEYLEGDDPRNIPYLLVWRSPEDGRIQEIVRLAREPSRVDPSTWTGWIEIKRPDEELGTYVRTLDRSLPRNGGQVQLLVCPECQAPRRALHGWRPGGTYTTTAERWRWQCRKCLGLRYSSEGGALAHQSRRPIVRLIEFLFNPLTPGRPEPWYPYVFTASGVCFGIPL